MIASSLTYIPSYLDFDWHQQYWLTHKNGDFNETIDQQTHELRLAYDAGGNVTWLGGLYAYQIETTGQLFIQFGPDELFPGSPAGLWLDASDVRASRIEGHGVVRRDSLLGFRSYANCRWRPRLW